MSIMKARTVLVISLSGSGRRPSAFFFGLALFGHGFSLHGNFAMLANPLGTGLTTDQARQTGPGGTVLSGLVRLTCCPSWVRHTPPPASVLGTPAMCVS